MKRKIIQIDEEKCNGCAICIAACHEGAIGLENGKAKLLRDDYCDGLGDCLPACPVGAITFTEREAMPYNEKAVKENSKKKKGHFIKVSGCFGHSSYTLRRKNSVQENSIKEDIKTRLRQWPVQIKLVPINAPYFNNSNLLIAANCTAFSFGNFHEKFIKNRITLIGCPKLDGVDYAEKLTEIIKSNDFNNITVVKMGVPCCNGIAEAVRRALKESGKIITWQIITISIEGEIIKREKLLMSRCESSS